MLPLHPILVFGAELDVRLNFGAALGPVVSLFFTLPAGPPPKLPAVIPPVVTVIASPYGASVPIRTGIATLGPSYVIHYITDANFGYPARTRT